MLQIAHLADIHLGHAQYNLTIREEDLYEAFQEAINKILEDHIDVVVIAGDLFDHPRPSNKTIIKFKEIIQPLHQKNIPIIIVRGDHDTPKYRDKDIIELISSFFPNIKHLDYKKSKEWSYTIEKNGVKHVFYGMPYIPPSYRISFYKKQIEIIRNDQKEEKTRKIVIGHFPIKQYMFFEEALEINTLPEEVAYYALGHLHDRILEKKEKTTIAYPGSIDIIDKKEIEIWKKKGKGYYMVDLSSEEAIVEKINIDIRPQEIIRGEYPSIIKQIEQYIKDEKKHKKPILHIEIECDKKQKQEAINKIKELVENTTEYTRINIREKETRNTLLLPQTMRTEKELVNQLIKNKEIASLIVDLKDCLAAKQDCEQIIETILAAKNYWSKTIVHEKTIQEKHESPRQQASKLDFFLR